MSTTRSAATTSVKGGPTTVRTWRARQQDDDALDAVQRFVSDAKGRSVTKTEALRLALEVAAMFLGGQQDAITEAIGKDVPRALDDDLVARLDQVEAHMKAAEEAYRGLDRQVQAIGNNLNQLTVLGHTGDRVPVAAVENVERELRRIADEMVLWERFDNSQRLTLMYER